MSLHFKMYNFIGFWRVFWILWVSCSHGFRIRDFVLTGSFFFLVVQTFTPWVKFCFLVDQILFLVGQFFSHGSGLFLVGGICFTFFSWVQNFVCPFLPKVKFFHWITRVVSINHDYIKKLWKIITYAFSHKPRWKHDKITMPSWGIKKKHWPEMN